MFWVYYTLFNTGGGGRAQESNSGSLVVMWLDAWREAWVLIFYLMTTALNMRATASSKKDASLPWNQTQATARAPILIHQTNRKTPQNKMFSKLLHKTKGV